ncbi:putative aliphatic sulfonates transport permease protein SsuC [compost metagenome]|uniref:ABC transporter permease n=1 Tax=Paenibacillus stellifer TaxID=169760 RepID=A0A089N707_9BACL|nr:ABC transporter permease [Paenibacillus stellifer]AIQ64554.1 ABC transporter permease [Paenibacillus stellifer]
MKWLLSVHRALLSFYLFFLVIIIWELAPRLGLVSDVFVPPFSRVVKTGVDLGLTNILLYISISLKRVFFGFILATILALPVGFILAGAVPKLAVFLRPLTKFLSSIPPYILFPVFVIIVGVGEGGIYTVIFWSSFWPILFTTIAGIQNVDPLLIRAAKSMNASKVTIFTKVILPGASPTLITGLRTGLTMSFFMLIGSESMGADSGMGWMIHNAQSMGFVERIYLGAIMVAGVGLALNYVLEYLENSILTWRQAPESSSKAAA